MNNSIVRCELLEWLNTVQAANLVYFKVRRDCWTSLVSRLSDNAAATVTANTYVPAERVVKLDQSDIFTIKGFLCRRSEKETDSGELAFTKTLEKWIES